MTWFGNGESFGGFVTIEIDHGIRKYLYWLECCSLIFTSLENYINEALQIIYVKNDFSIRSVRAGGAGGSWPKAF